MNAGEREEIAASVAAHAELGPRYDDAVAEGLVERIGEEIDKRVDARLRGMGVEGDPGSGRGAATGRQRPVQRQVPPPAASAAPAAVAPAPATVAPAQAAAHPAPPRSNGVTGMILGLGSMGLGVGATAVVVSHHANGVLVLIIWVTIMMINVAHSQRR